MKGILLTYNTKNIREITILNNQIFGRVIQVTRKNKKFYYYYKGLLDNIRYIKLTNGCYFIEANESLWFNEQVSLLTITTSDIRLDSLSTAREHFKQKYKDIEVINL